MGAVKQMMAERDQLERCATALLVEVGALRECPGHEGLFFNGGREVEDAYKLANSRITRGLVDLPSWASRREFTDVLKKTYEEYSIGDECAWCAKTFED